MQSIVSLFDIQAPVVSVQPLGEGLINDTYLVRTSGDADDYVLQRINTRVFPDVELLMSNIGVVTAHLASRLRSQGVSDLRRRVLQFVPARGDAHRLYVESQSQYWRLMVYIARSQTRYEVNAANAEAAGMAFGQFQLMLSDLPVTLAETIPDFHNMEFRLRQLRQACADNLAGRLSRPEVQELLSQLELRAGEMTLAERLHRQGRLPRRVCHCDTKVNNILFSDDGSEVLCVIDLDTVMPSFIFSDYGDFLRTAASSVAEDEPDFARIAFRSDIYQAFTRGYLSQARAFLTPLEVDMLPFAVRLFPYMQSVRFLWDYLNGDQYWKVLYPDHNLVRAQNQYHYLTRIEEYFKS